MKLQPPHRKRHSRALTLLWAFPVLVCLAAALTGCTTTAPYADDGRPAGGIAGEYFIANVPFYPQDDYQCGPASLAALLDFHGDPVPPGEIASSIFREQGSDSGTLFLDMVLYARSLGYQAQWKNAGHVTQMLSYLEADVPIIVMVDMGLGPARQLHFMVATGFDAAGLRVHSGREPDKHLPWRTFLKQWGRTRSLFLVITPHTGTSSPPKSTTT